MTAKHAPVISCDPRRQFGRPCIHGTRITAETIAGSVWAGDSVDSIASDYEIDRLDVLWCCAWWVDGGALIGGKDRERRKQWTLWTEWAHRVLGGWVKGRKLCDPDDFEPEVAS